MKNKGDLTKGSVLGVIVSLSMPIVAAAFLSTIYSIVDMAWIGLMGGEVLAGVGAGGMYVWLSSGIVALPRMGGQILMGQELGRGNKKKALVYATCTIHMTLIIGSVFGGFVFWFAKPLIGYFQMQSIQAMEAAIIYTKIVVGLSVFPFLGQTLTGLFTAQGDSKTPLFANTVGLVLNMILDPFLIFGWGIFPELGTVGAAVATVIAQCVVVGILFLCIYKNKAEGNVLRQLRLWVKSELIYYKHIVKLGLPNALQNLVYCMISMILSRTISRFGDIVLAVFRVGGQIESVSWNVANGFGSSMNAFTAQNYGAKDYERVKKGYRYSSWIVLIWGLFITVLFLGFSSEISSVFFHTNTEIQVSNHYLRIVSYSQAFMCLELMSVGALAGLGKTKLCSIISIIFTVIRIPMAMCFGKIGWNESGVWWALTISSILKGILLWIAFQKELRYIRK